LTFNAMPSTAAFRKVANITKSARDAMRFLRILVQSPQQMAESFLQSPERQDLILPWSFHSAGRPRRRDLCIITAMAGARQGTGIVAGRAGGITEAYGFSSSEGARVSLPIPKSRKFKCGLAPAKAILTRSRQEITASRGIVAHASTTDSDSRLYRKAAGREAKLSYVGHAVMENRHGLGGGRHGHPRHWHRRALRLGDDAQTKVGPAGRRITARTRPMTPPIMSPSFVLSTSRRT
jgi:hypothetical protein